MTKLSFGLLITAFHECYSVASYAMLCYNTINKYKGLVNIMHSMFDNKKVIIFDVDGTLIDSIGMWNSVDGQLIDIINNTGKAVDYDNIQHERNAFQLANKHLAKPYIAYCGFLKEKYNSHLEPEDMHTMRYGIAQQYIANSICYKDNAAKLIHQLHQQGYTLVIATNTQRRVMDIYRTINHNFIDTADIDTYFSLVYVIEDIGNAKPDPCVHHMIMDKIGVAPEQCLVFEDSLVGVQAAHNAGIQCVAIYDKYSDNERNEINSLATYTIDGFDQVL